MDIIRRGPGNRWRIVPDKPRKATAYRLVNLGPETATGVTLQRRDDSRTRMSDLPDGVTVEGYGGTNEHPFHVSRSLGVGIVRPKFLYVTWDGHEMPVQVELPA